MHMFSFWVLNLYFPLFKKLYGLYGANGASLRHFRNHSALPFPVDTAEKFRFTSTWFQKHFQFPNCYLFAPVRRGLYSNWNNLNDTSSNIEIREATLVS